MLASGVTATREETVARNGMVAAGHRLEAETGVAVLRRGGNAVDAAVAAAFVAEMAEPAMCGIGAHGVMSVHWAATGEKRVIDFYDVAPSAASPQMYEIIPGGDVYPGPHAYPRVRNDAQSDGHLSVMVPSQLAGLCAAHRRYGSVPLRDLIAPAVGLAEEGVPVDRPTMGYILSTARSIRRYPETASYLLKDGLPLRAPVLGAPGDTIVRRDLARTLREIANDGPDVFYRGHLAEAMARDMDVNGGIMTLDDLAAYEPMSYEAEPFTYRGFEYVTGGNVTVVEALNILELFDPKGTEPDSPEFVHVMMEAMRLAWADTLAHVGDPRTGASPWAGLTSKAYAAKRARLIDPDRAAERVGPGDPWEFEGRARPETRRAAGPEPPPGAGQTTRVVAADSDGNLASLIISLGHAFGSRVTVPGTGILLNNSMHRLDPRPGYLNSVAPGKGMQRLTAAIEVFRDGRPFAAFGTSLTIYMGSTGIHPMVNVMDFGMGVQQAIEACRFHPAGDAMWVDSRMPEPLRRALSGMGHRLVPREQRFLETHFGNTVGVLVDPVTGLFHGGADPFHTNAVAGY